MIFIYLDAEFDAVRIHHKYEQAVISIGAVLCGMDLQEADSFYAMVRPRSFRRLTPVVRRMTHLKDKDVLHGAPLEKVVQDFLEWIYKYETDLSNVQLFSFGPDDRRTLVRNCRFHNISCSLFEAIQDLQKVLSRDVMLHQKMLSPTLSLDNLKSIYDVDGCVDHNALNDARDLMKCHVRKLQGYTRNETSIMKIAQRMEEKEASVKRKQQEQLWKMLHQRFHNVAGKKISITLFPEVVNQFRLWEDREANFVMHWKKKEMILYGVHYVYSQLALDLLIDSNKEVYYITLFMKYMGEESKYTYLLSYRNATMIENILRHQEHI